LQRSVTDTPHHDNGHDLQPCRLQTTFKPFLRASQSNASVCSTDKRYFNYQTALALAMQLQVGIINSANSNCSTVENITARSLEVHPSDPRRTLANADRDDQRL
jgi:hypothetical protein